MTEPRGDTVAESTVAESGGSIFDGLDIMAELERVEQNEALELLRVQVEALLPWVSRTTGSPVAMWIEEVGLVSGVHEPFAPGTPFALVTVASWEAAQAVRESLKDVARIDEVRWSVGWQRRAHGRKSIRIYPDFAAA